MGLKNRNARHFRILVAEHNTRLRNQFLRQLRVGGYDAVGVGTGKKALAELRASRFDLLVLNLEIPDLKGFGFLKTIRAELPHVLVMVVSGRAHAPLLQAASWFGAVAALEKAKASKVLLDEAQRLLGDAA